VAGNIVGLDIGTTAVRAAELSTHRGQAKLERIGRAELPPGAVVDGEVADPAAVAAAIKTLWRQARLRSNRVILGLSNQQVVVRLVDLPWMEPEELRRSIAYQAGDYLPIAVNEAELDFSVIDERDTGDRRLLRVLLVAAQKAMLAGHLRAATMAGLHPVGVDVNPLALLRSLAPVAGLAEGAEALVDIGGRVTNVVIHDGGVLRFIRILLMGGDDVTSALERTLDLDHQAAEQAKLAVSAGQDQDADAEDIVHQQLAAFVDEVRGSLDFYRSQQSATPLTKVIVSGGGSLLGPLADQLQAAAGVPVERARAFASVSVGKLNLDAEELAQLEPTVAVPVGLALRAVS